MSGELGTTRIALVAGEASGDLLGAGLIRELRERFPTATFAGIGGPRMIEAGLDAWFPAEKLAVMGLVEVLKHLPELLAIRRDTLRRALDWKPDVFVGIDAPDFNLGLERKLKRAGIRTVHYVSPSVWAWREGRARKIGRSADLVLCLFPMEPPIYAKHGVDARFVGHPLADAFALEPARATARAALGIDANATVLALLPGSRLGEIARLGRDLLGAANILRAQFPNLQIVAPMANAACREAFTALVNESTSPVGAAEAATAEVGNSAVAASAAPIIKLEVKIIDGQAHEAMIASNAVLLASGTAALEAMLAKREMVVAYRLAPMTYRLVKWLGLMKVDRYALPNVLADRAIVPEIMQDDCKPETLAAALAPMLARAALPSALADEYRRLHLALKRDADREAAAAVAALVRPAARVDHNAR